MIIRISDQPLRVNELRDGPSHNSKHFCAGCSDEGLSVKKGCSSEQPRALALTLVVTDSMYIHQFIHLQMVLVVLCNREVSCET